MAQIISTQGSTYLMRLKGALSSPNVDWCGDISITADEQNETLQVSLILDLDAIRGFLDQFQDLSLTILPPKSTENEILQNNA
jgi:hypothetical protein